MYQYDTQFNPPAPVFPVQISSPSKVSFITVPTFIDSGSDITVIPHAMVQDLNLRSVGVVRSQGFGEIGESTVFSALISVERQEPEVIDVLTWDEDYVLLGRDIINRWKVTLDGPGQVLSISR